MRTIIVLTMFLTGLNAQGTLRPSPHFGERVSEEWHDGGVRVTLNAPANVDANKPNRLILFATPNGNTIEQTLGCAKAEGLDWHYDIQHVAAQVRCYREQNKNENVFLAVVEAGGLTWPSYRAKFKDNPERIRKLVDGLRDKVTDAKVTLTGHSGGGSFTSGFINAYDTLPAWLDRIAWLDSNYSYSDDDKHGDKLLAWLKYEKNRVIVIAYDDREIMLDGKKVVGPTGGTWRATQRMIDRFATDLMMFAVENRGDFEYYNALHGRVHMCRHKNPQNKILHTRLVGEMNGLLEALTFGGEQTWGTFAGPVAYAKFIQPAPGIAARKADALSGSALVPILATLPKEQREDRIAKEVLEGNVPAFLRNFVKVKVEAKDAAGKPHVIVMEVLPDYVSLGNDADWLRMPMNLRSAKIIYDAWGCVLPTAKMVDLIHANAAVKLEPIPLGEPREAVEQFANHHKMIEEQRKHAKLGELVSGVKKDVVWSNRVWEKPKRLALYGWHKLDGQPIQPLTIVHHDGYVDYSHGVRPVKSLVLLDGKPKELRDILRDPNLAVMLSGEGVLKQP